MVVVIITMGLWVVVNLVVLLVVIVMKHDQYGSLACVWLR